MARTSSAKPAESAAKKKAAPNKKTPAKSTTAKAKSATRKRTADKTVRPWVENYPDGVIWDSPINTTPVHQRVAQAAADNPNALALDFLGAETSFGNMWRDIERLSGALQNELGVKKGDRVALLLPNTPYYVVAYYALLLAGATVVNCNPLYSAPELIHITKDSGADIVITLDLKATFDKAEELHASGAVKTIIVCDFAAALPGLKSLLYRLVKRSDISNVSASKAAGSLVFYKDLIAANHTPKPAKIDADKDVAVQQYTGGTTGVPKGAMLSHANISANVGQIDVYGLGIFNPPSKTVAVLPFFHIFAMTVCLNTPLCNGASVIMMPKFDLKTFIGLVKRTRANILPAVPTLTNAIANAPNLNKADIASIELLISGGAALPNDLRSAFEKVSDAILAEGYGLTEASPVVTCAGLRSPSKPMSIGMPLPGTDIRFVDVDNPEKPVPMGERGELQVKGPQVMLGYFGDKTRTRDTFIDGWLRTGDVGYIDEDGFVFLVDRIKDLIISSGYNVYPRTIEEALNDHPKVDECNVIGAPDDYRGEVPVAFVKLKDGETITDEDLKTFLTERISVIEMPRDIIFKDELPKTLVGKLSKNELREELANREGNA